MTASFLDREHTVAAPGFNRFLVPPAALAVHLSIGQAYAFSTFNLPLTKLIGLSHSAPGDWDLKQVGWIFSIAIVPIYGWLVAKVRRYGVWGRPETIGTIESVRDSLRRLADHCKLSDTDREALFEELRRWVYKDYRAKSEA